MCPINNLQGMTPPLLSSLLFDLILATKIQSFSARYQALIVGSVSFSQNGQPIGYVSQLYKHRHHVVTDKITERGREMKKKNFCTDLQMIHIVVAAKRILHIQCPQLAFICTIAWGQRHAGWHTCLLMCQLV